MSCEANALMTESVLAILHQADRDEAPVVDREIELFNAAVIAAGHENKPEYKAAARDGTNIPFLEVHAEVRAEREVEIIYGDIIGPRGLISG